MHPFSCEEVHSFPSQAITPSALVSPVFHLVLSFIFTVLVSSSWVSPPFRWALNLFTTFCSLGHRLMARSQVPPFTNVRFPQSVRRTLFLQNTTDASHRLFTNPNSFWIFNHGFFPPPFFPSVTVPQRAPPPRPGNSSLAPRFSGSPSQPFPPVADPHF